MPRKRNEDTLIAVFAFVVVLGLLFFGRNYLIKRRGKSRPVTTEISQPSPPVAAEPVKPLVENGKVEATEGCRDRKPLDFFLLDARDMAQVRSGEVREFLAGPIFCVKLGPLPFKFRANFSETDRGYLAL